MIRTFALLFLAVLSSSAAELRGTISDYTNGEPLSGVIVRIPDLNAETLSVLSGEYVLRDIPVGTHVVRFARAGYAPYSYEQKIADATRSYGRDIELHPAASGDMSEEPRFRLPEVQVLTTRASATSPVTFTNLSQQEIQNQNYGQDTPLLLSELPNVSTYSEGGAGMGYSYLRMRGMSQDRIAVQINGVPLNDAETHEVFWVDLPDLAEDLADVQVQRGVGSSLYGPAAFGGTINMVTRTPGLGDRPMIRAEGTYGAWNTRRAMVQFQSGRIQNRYGISARLTRMDTDSYRENSWARLWSYYLSAARFTPRHTTRLIFYGGPEKTHLAYEGVNKDHLEGRVTGDKEHDRRFNEFQFPGEIDNFFQPHYELHDEWKLSDRVTFDNSLYLFKGDGYYDQWRTGEPDSQYFYANYGRHSIDVLRRRNVNEIDGGWIPRASVEHKYGTTVIGGDVRLHDARHEGIVLWASETPVGVRPDYHYYDYKIRKTSGSGYVHNLFRISDRLRALADVQYARHRIRMKDDKLWLVTYRNTYTSLSPRAGLHYTLMQGQPTASIYSSLSIAQREPKPRDIYDPQDYYSIPPNSPGHFGIGEFNPQYGVWRTPYIGPSLKPEKLIDFEFGTQWLWRRVNLGANIYYMQLRDAIVPYGALDNLGLLVTINAEKTLHQGIEFVAGADPVDGLRMTGNVALTDHHFVNHTEYDFAVGDSVARDGNRVAFDPEYVANGRVEYNYRGLRAGMGVRSVGKQYVDNTQTDSTAVPAYTIVSFDLCYRFTHVPGLAAADVKLRVNNLFNVEYEAFGYNYGEARYIVGVPRAAYVTLGVEL